MIIPIARGLVSFSGYVLAGGRLLRHVFIDEAGVAAQEPVAVVAGVITLPDEHWGQLREHLAAIARDHLPAADRAGFVFHAKDIFHGSGYFQRDKWPLDVRLEILRRILGARTSIGFSVSIGFNRREDGKYKNEQGYALVRHLTAYASCIAGCEAYIREFGSADEVAILVCEDTPDAKRHIRDVHHDLISPNPEFPAMRDLFPFRHIVDTVHFAEKDRSPLLQFADAYAFAFRRHLGGYSHSEPLMDAIGHGPVNWQDR